MIKLRTLALSAAVLAVTAAPASAVVMFDQNVTNNAIFGGGNTNGSYTTDRANGVEVGLRGKLRHNAAGAPENTFNSNGDGTYSFDAGVAPTQAAPTGVWSFEWSINSNWDGTGSNLDALSYVLGIDSDPGAGAAFTTFDPINDNNPNSGTVCWDHSMGDNGTAMGSGDEVDCNGATPVADYAAAIASNNLAQNSWKAHWFIPGFDPTVDGEYDFYLAAVDASGNPIARTDMTIIVGDGATTSVPAPAPLALLGLGLLGLGALRGGRRSV